MGLDDARAFVSGSTQGIGYAIADGLVREGAEVVINGRDGEKVAGAVEALRHAVPRARVSGIAADVGDPAAVEDLIDGLGPVDVLVNNAGLFEQREFVDLTDEDWRHYLDVNLMSGVRLSRRLLPGMLERNRGRVIFISSESGVNVPPDMVHYGVTKAAQIALANGLAKLTRGTAVTVNSILGGPTYSTGVATVVEAIAAAQRMDADVLRGALAGRNRTSLLERFIEPDEIAAFAVYLASPQSSAVNGAALRADGGVLTGLL